jgi:poly(3-hydroxybutyrate) depolymerase
MKKRYGFLITVFFLTASIAISQETNLLKNTEFDDVKHYWKAKTFDVAAMTFNINADSKLSGVNSGEIVITKGGSIDEHVQLQQGLTVEIGKFYHISFMAMSTVPHTIKAVFEPSSDITAQAWSSPAVAIDNTPRHFGPFTLKSRIPTGVKYFKLLLGGLDNVTVYVDSIIVTATDDSSYIDPIQKFEKKSYTFQTTTLPYRLCRPDHFNPAQKYPLVLALHGVGECGTDNEIHIAVHHMATAWADSANQANHPCFVVAPQCPIDNRWVDAPWAPGTYSFDDVPLSNELATVNDLLDSLAREFPIDPDRLYVTGLSMGGFGTWDIITRFPKRFAAAIPMSGGGDSTKADVIKNIPIWVFHGEKDSTVPVKGSRMMIQALENQGLHCVYTDCNLGDCTGLPDSEVDQLIDAGAPLLYTEYKGKDHVCWAESYDNPQLIRWTFMQNRANQTGVEQDASPVLVQDFTLAQNYPNPFNAQTMIPFILPQAAHVRIQIFNMLGQEVARPVDGRKLAGRYTIQFDASGLPSGNYLYKATAGSLTAKKMMTLLR